MAEWVPKMPRHRTVLDTETYRCPHMVWNMQDAEVVEVTHRPPKTMRDYAALYMIKTLRVAFDKFTHYKPGKTNESMYLRRLILLETVAAVPGMIGGMFRHFAALRFLRADGGWIHHLLEEAENERMHLLTFLKMKQPSMIERVVIIAGQFVFVLYYFMMYLASYRLAHRLVGYLEEEAVKTYTNLIKEIEEGRLPGFDKPAMPEAIQYWALADNAKYRDIFVAVRADEVAHREFNHHFADISKHEPMTHYKLYIKNEKNINWEGENQKL